MYKCMHKFIKVYKCKMYIIQCTLYKKRMNFAYIAQNMEQQHCKKCVTNLETCFQNS